jgi:hypothetical protein
MASRESTSTIALWRSTLKIYVSVAPATHAEECTMLAAIAEFVGVACRGANKDSGWTAEKA